MMLIILLISCSKAASKIKDKQFTPAKTDIVTLSNLKKMVELKKPDNLESNRVVCISCG